MNGLYVACESFFFLLLSNTQLSDFFVIFLSPVCIHITITMLSASCLCQFLGATGKGPWNALSADVKYAVVLVGVHRPRCIIWNENFFKMENDVSVCVRESTVAPSIAKWALPYVFVVMPCCCFVFRLCTTLSFIQVHSPSQHGLNVFVATSKPW